MVAKRKEYPRVECEVCKKSYPKVRAWQRFCSDNCRLASYRSTLERQMKDIKSGARSNGNTAAMKGIMFLVNDEEIHALSLYLSSLK